MAGGNKEVSVKLKGDIVALPVAADEEIFRGTCVCINTDGYAVAGDDAAGLVFAGIAEEHVKNDGDAGDKWIRVRTRGDFEMLLEEEKTVPSMNGVAVYLATKQTATADETVNTADKTDNDVLIGYVVEHISTTKVRVRVNTFTHE